MMNFFPFFLFTGAGIVYAFFGHYFWWLGKRSAGKVVQWVAAFICICIICPMAALLDTVFWYTVIKHVDGLVVVKADYLANTVAPNALIVYAVMLLIGRIAWCLVIGSEKEKS